MSFKSERQNLSVDRSAQAGLNTKKDPHPEVGALPEELIRLLATLSKEGLGVRRRMLVNIALSPPPLAGSCQITISLDLGVTSWSTRRWVPHHKRGA